MIFLRLRQLLIREAPETDTTFPWGVQFAKQLAAINKQLFENGFEEIIQWAQEGKLWKSPGNKEAGFDDGDSEFYEYISG